MATILLFAYCNQTPINNSDHIVDYSEELKCDFDSLLESVQYVPLELTEESSFMQVTQLLLDDDYIYIFDSFSNSLKVFSWSGKFVKSLGRMGHGPGEYDRISSVCMDKNYLYMNDLENKILEFSKKTLSFSREYPNSYGYSFFKMDDNWIFMDYYGDYLVKVYNSNFEEIYQAIPNLVKTGYLEWPVYRFYESSGYNYVYPPHYNQIYCINEDSCFLIREIKYGNLLPIPNEMYLEKAKTNNMNDIRNDDVHVQYCKHIDGKDFFITSFRVGNKYYLGINQKSDNKTFFCASDALNYSDCHFIFVPEGSWNDKFLSICNLKNLQKLPFCYKNKSFISLSDTISPESDILVLWKLKQK